MKKHYDEKEMHYMLQPSLDTAIHTTSAYKYASHESEPFSLVLILAPLRPNEVKWNKVPKCLTSVKALSGKSEVQ